MFTFVYKSLTCSSILVLLLLLNPTIVCDAAYSEDLVFPYLKIENDNIQTMRNAVESVRKTISVLRRNIEEIKLEHEEAIFNPKLYVSNPVNCFKLVKRLVVDFDQHIKKVQTKLILPDINEKSMFNLMRAFQDIDKEERYGAVLTYGGVEAFHAIKGFLGDETFLYYLLRRYKETFRHKSKSEELLDQGTFQEILKKTFAMQKSNDQLYDTSDTFEFLVGYFFDSVV